MYVPSWTVTPLDNDFLGLYATRLNKSYYESRRNRAVVVGGGALGLGAVGDGVDEVWSIEEGGGVGEAKD